MSISQIDLFHGSVLSKITRNESNKISLIEWSRKRKSGDVQSGNRAFQ